MPEFAAQDPNELMSAAALAAPTAYRQLSEDLLGAVFVHAPVAMRITAPDGGTRVVNTALCDLLKLEETTLLGSNLEELIHADDFATVQRAYTQMREGQISTWDHDVRLRCTHVGTPEWVWTQSEARAIRDTDGNLVAIIEQFVDMTEVKMREEHLSQNATHDSLTGLPNRRLLLDRLSGALARNARKQSRVAVLFCDLDRFKEVNDSLGHAAGDELLVQIAERIKSVVRNGDTVARLGGDEFVIVCEDAGDTSEVTAVAKRIMHTVDVPFPLAAGTVSVGVSIGVAIGTSETHDPEALVADADMAVFHAKTRGRNRIINFEASMRTAAQGRIELEHELEAAITNKEIIPYFQPIIDVQTGTVIGFEAFARWQHPTRGLLTPAAFLTVAEDSGLVVQLGDRMLDAVCEELTNWQGKGAHGVSPYVAMTCSTRQLALPDLPERILECITRHDVDPSLICLQITESAITLDADVAVERMARLRDVGVRIAIDDFGVDSSSLAYLRKFPVNIVKIDTSFIADLGNDANGSTIVAAVIALAHALGLTVVAEGVESIEQLTALYTLACDHAQGFLFAQPAPAQEVDHLLSHALGIA